MRELKPLLLRPDILRIHTASASPPSHDGHQHGYSRQSSLHSVEPSPASSQTFSIGSRTHLSSRSSSPPRYDLVDLYKRCAPSPSLPNVQEHPLERDGPGATHPNVHSAPPSALEETPRSPAMWSLDRHAMSSTQTSLGDSRASVDLNLMRDGFFSDSELVWDHQLKRRLSGESSTLNNFATRIMTRLPSLKRSRERKRASLPTVRIPTSPSDSIHPLSSLHSPLTSRSRSNSRARSMLRRSREMDADRESDQDFANPIETIAEDEVEIPDLVANSELLVQDDSLLDADNDYVRVSTPLLTPLLPDADAQDPDWQLAHLHRASESSIPNNSTCIASDGNSPHATPAQSTVASPALSKRASTNSFHRQQTQRLVPCSEIPTIHINEGPDPWSERLGHANFTIEPQPYRVDDATQQSCTKLFQDWHQARLEYSKHLHRTDTHFGPTSPTYQMTEQKWADVECQWRQCYETAVICAEHAGHVQQGELPKEPPPVAKVPAMQEGQSEGKFPTLGDADIVGPMQKAVPHGATDPQNASSGRPSRKSQLLRAFLFPTSLLQKSQTSSSS